MIMLSVLAFSAGAALMAALIWLESQRNTLPDAAQLAPLSPESQRQSTDVLTHWKPRRAYRPLL